MTRNSTTLSRSYFEELYERDPDPWNFRSSAYERDKYHATLAALPRAHYARGLELGCSIGLLTKMLSARCRRLTAVDGSQNAIGSARIACRGLENISFLRMMVPKRFPHGKFDLILLSEILYFLAVDDVRLLARLCLSTLLPHGDMVLVHWLGETNYPLSGDDAAESFIAAAQKGAAVLWRSRQPMYRLDLLRKRPGAAA
jgi:trans-aconitate methyltransferase